MTEVPTSELSSSQQAVVQRPLEGKTFLEGVAGTGKTTAGVARMLHLVENGVAAGSILVLTPQRTLGTTYQKVARRPGVPAGGEVNVMTVGGLAQRTVDLFWPVIVEDAGFGDPEAPPTFLTIETAQYHMARLVAPLLERGYFSSLTIHPQRLYSQILDNLNKAAVVGFPYTEIGARLKSGWGGERSRLRVYDEAQVCATRFREYCLAHNLLDFSLQYDVFFEYLWSMPLCQNYLLAQYRNVIVDNAEEDTPRAHDLLTVWLKSCASALVIYDQEAGFRTFLGADADSGAALANLCGRRITFDESFVTSPAVQKVGVELATCLGQESRRAVARVQGTSADVREAMCHQRERFYPQMLDWVSDEIAALVHGQGVAPGDVVVLAPFVPDSLRFSLSERLEARDVPVRSHRPSRALWDEPATHCLITLASLAHPEWGISVSQFDLARALVQVIEDLDPVRARLLAHHALRRLQDDSLLKPFEQIDAEIQERVTYLVGRHYEELRQWLTSYVETRTVGPDAAVPVILDHFLARLFGEVLSQPGYGLHQDYDGARVVANLIESARKFREVVEPVGDKSIAQELVEIVRGGVIPAQYVSNWSLEVADAVLLAPAHTFLLANRPVDYQFWLDVGNRGWWERLSQPLTQPYVLSRHWPRDAVWSEDDEHRAQISTLHRLIQGLLRRCRKRVYLALSDLGENGREQRGLLLQVTQRMLRRVIQKEVRNV